MTCEDFIGYSTRPTQPPHSKPACFAPFAPHGTGKGNGLVDAAANVGGVGSVEGDLHGIQLVFQAHHLLKELSFHLLDGPGRLLDSQVWSSSSSCFDRAVKWSNGSGLWSF